MATGAISVWLAPVRTDKVLQAGHTDTQTAPVYCHTNNRRHSLSARRMLWTVQPITLFVLRDRCVMSVKEIFIFRRC
jgi:hypothetical protein